MPLGKPDHGIRSRQNTREEKTHLGKMYLITICLASQKTQRARILQKNITQTHQIKTQVQNLNRTTEAETSKEIIQVQPKQHPEILKEKGKR